MSEPRSTAPSPPPETTLELDARGEGAMARLRLVAAVVVLLASIWLAALGPGLVGWVLVALGLLASLGWMVAWARARRRRRAPERWYLRVDREGLRLAQGGEPRVIPWSSVEAVEVDEDRLTVRLRLADAPPAEIPPIWRGVGLHDLAELLEGGLRSARPAPGG